MFIGHYGVAFAAKTVAPRVPLGVTFIAVQLLDVLFASFLFAGVEHMRIVPGVTQYNPYVLDYMPYTHSLAGSVGWSVVGGAAWYLARRNGREALVVAGAVFSHFILDVPMHTPDLPLLGEDSYKLGFGLWNHWHAALALELVTLLGGWAIWMVWRGPSDRPRPREIAFLVALVVIAVGTPFMPTPSSPEAFGVQALVLYLLFAVLAQATDVRPTTPIQASAATSRP
jgi:hypothetical protein